MSTVVTLLAREHLQLQRLSDELATAPAGPAVLDVLTATVARHLSAEERYLYPAVRALVPGGERLIATEISHDTAILRGLRRLRRCDPRAVPAMAAELMRQLHRHAHHAATDIYPRLAESASDADLRQLGLLVTKARRTAPTRPHPHLPARTPWSRLAHPVAGAVDRLRDRLDGRRPG